MTEKIESEKELTKAEAPVADAPKKSAKEIKADAIKSKFAEFKDYSDNKLRSNSKFNRMASEVLDNGLSELSEGENPSAKYLVQKFVAGDDTSKYAEFMAKLAPEEEFIGAGQGAEYILTNGLAVNKLDNTKFVPEVRNDMGNYTYVDNITLSDNPADFDKVEVSIAQYLYIQYYLSGKIDELVNIIRPKLQQAFTRRQAKAVLNLVQEIFRTVHAKDSTTDDKPTNRLVGNTQLTQVDAMKEFLDFEFKMGFDNQQFNYDERFGGYNSLPDANKVYVCEYQTYNNFKKYATTFLSKEKIEEYFKMDKWIVLPTSIYNNSTRTPTEKGSIEQILTLSAENGEKKVERVAGAILVLDNRALKRVYNYAKETAQYYAPNDTTQLFAFKNWAIKYLKWGQVAVYENAALEANFIVPISQDSK